MSQSFHIFHCFLLVLDSKIFFFPGKMCDSCIHSIDIYRGAGGRPAPATHGPPSFHSVRQRAVSLPTPLGRGLMAVLLQLLMDPLFPLSQPACGEHSHPTGWGLGAVAV